MDILLVSGNLQLENSSRSTNIQVARKVYNEIKRMVNMKEIHFGITEKPIDVSQQELRSELIKLDIQVELS
jgi:hypothetical protein